MRRIKVFVFLFDKSSMQMWNDGVKKKQAFVNRWEENEKRDYIKEIKPRLFPCVTTDKVQLKSCCAYQIKQNRVFLECKKKTKQPIASGGQREEWRHVLKVATWTTTLEPNINIKVTKMKRRQISIPALLIFTSFPTQFTQYHQRKTKTFWVLHTSVKSAKR